MTASSRGWILVIVQVEVNSLLCWEVQRIQNYGQLLKLHQFQTLSHFWSNKTLTSAGKFVQLAIFKVESNNLIIQPLGAL